ncbi:hypothetical protein JXB22_00155 [candidate division WOR-3 bacterium]|nr:hypothetical protein [candidate division WOR-3 bacterium]
MKVIMILLLCTTLVFAVKPVPRPENKSDVKNVKTATEVVQNKDKDDDKKDDAGDDAKITKDHFKDDNADGVNDQREDDLQKIKNTKTKEKDVKTNKKVNTPSSNKKPAIPKKVNKK